MSQDLQTQSSKRPETKRPEAKRPEAKRPEVKRPEVKPDGKVLPFNRDMAWQVAPTLLSSFRYAWMGLSYAFQTQRNFRIHTILGTSAVILGVVLHLSTVELAVIGLTCGAVMAMELLNTAIESVVDLTVKQNFHELAKIAKDCAAAAVLVAAIVAMLVAGCLILPKLVVAIGMVLG